ncbi:ketopantoate reductase family protein [Caldibacillus lycopersici]|uniref:2-dehydropantoate 2-reductase n=1 Tax=Perspicuibacillus lycopersici TaxID=1325689 RepID=A0AAE3LNA1_9BACI|nr:ketopantoate reductase family protein [Perspicuibacillus lycopersici]MCU9614470.1 ketopantoate reductase family protein [Perspicuibacillus lycopersici]
MHITVLGAGALGVYFGGRMQEVGHEVTFLVREKRAQQIDREGLQIHSVAGDYTIHDVRTVQTTDAIRKVDLVLLAVKGYHLEGAIPQLKELVEKGAKVLPVLNGVEHFQLLQEILGEENVIGGLSFIIATLDENGHVHHASDQHSIVLGPLHDSQLAFCEQFAESLQKANMEVSVNENILTAIWDKYMFITAFSGLTSAVNLPIGQIRQVPATFQLGVQLLKEMKALANHHGIPLADENIEQKIAIWNSLPEAGTSSMHQDKRKGLPLELDSLQGAALRLAEKIKLELPTIKVIYSILKPYEKGI